MPETGKWGVIIHRRVEKLLFRMPNEVVRRFSKTISALEHDPRPVGSKKLAGHENLYRLRVGDWRIIYALEETKLIILVLEISPRGDAYRNL